MKMDEQELESALLMLDVVDGVWSWVRLFVHG